MTCEKRIVEEIKRAEEIKATMKHVGVETGSLACLGCGHEHNCGVHGCAIIRDAVTLIEALQDRVMELEVEALNLEAEHRTEFCEDRGLECCELGKVRAELKDVRWERDCALISLVRIGEKIEELRSELSGPQEGREQRE